MSFELILLAVVQGIAEFLPISSSGHLVILGGLLGQLSESPTLEIILHAGTLGSILVVFWRKIVRMLVSDRHVIPLLVVGTLPAVVIGFVIKSRLEFLLRSPVLAAAMLIVTGALLLALGRLSQGSGKYVSMGWLGALLVGCFQAVAILPGISRSGATIFGARLIGLDKDDAVTFSFLLAIPAILGATVLEVHDLWTQHAAGGPLDFAPLQLIAGAVVSFAVGVLALIWLIRWNRQDRLCWFAWWCFPVGLIALIYFGFGMHASV